MKNYQKKISNKKNNVAAHTRNTSLECWRWTAWDGARKALLPSQLPAEKQVRRWWLNWESLNMDCWKEQKYFWRETIAQTFLVSISDIDSCAGTFLLWYFLYQLQGNELYSRNDVLCSNSTDSFPTHRFKEWSTLFWVTSW